MNDLYDRLRPADEPLDSATAHRVWDRISGLANDDAPEAVAQHRPQPLQFNSPRHRPNRRRFAAILAAAAAIAGIAATAGVIGNRSDVVTPADTVAPTPPTVSAETLPTVESTVVPPADPSTAPMDLVEGTDFAVIDPLPDGWQLDAMTATPRGSIFGGDQWAVVDEAGNVTGVISSRAPRLLSAEELADPDKTNTEVRGLPATEFQQGPESGSNVERSGIYWIEESLRIDLTASRDAQAMLRTVAEAIVLDEATRTLTVPDNLGLIHSSDLDFAPDHAVASRINVSTPADQFGVGVSTQPNTFGYSLPELAVEDLDWQPTQANGADALTATTPGGGTKIALLEGDMFITAASAPGGITADDLIAVISAIRFTDADEFRRIGDTLSGGENDEFASWEVFDEATTPGGITVTVRSKPGSGGANAICVETPEPICTLILSESGSIDGFELYGAAGFDIDGSRVGVAWVSDGFEISHDGDIRRPAEFTGAAVEPSDFLNPADGYLDGTTATIVLNQVADQGRFVIVDIPAGERPPSIRLTAANADPVDPAIEERFELTPLFTDPYSF